MDYTFTLKYRLAEGDRDTDRLVERLGEAGCTDAIVGVGSVGRLALEFTREADSADAAIRSALGDVRTAIPLATLVEAAPDFVGLTDIADLLGISRQGMRKLSLTHGDFPAPVHEGSASVWHLLDILTWLEGRRGHTPDVGLRDTAAAALAINLAKETSRHTGAHAAIERLTA